MTDQPDSSALPSIRRYLLYRIVGIVLFAFVVFALAEGDGESIDYLAARGIALQGEPA